MENILSIKEYPKVTHIKFLNDKKQEDFLYILYHKNEVRCGTSQLKSFSLDTNDLTKNGILTKAYSCKLDTIYLDCIVTTLISYFNNNELKIV